MHCVLMVMLCLPVKCVHVVLSYLKRQCCHSLSAMRNDAPSSVPQDRPLSASARAMHLPSQSSHSHQSPYNGSQVFVLAACGLHDFPPAACIPRPRSSFQSRSFEAHGRSQQTR